MGMNALTFSQPEGTQELEPVFCLRQRNSAAFWDGTGWVTNAGTVRSFHDLDHVLAVAQRTECRAIDLVVLFLSREHSLIIPLGS